MVECENHDCREDILNRIGGCIPRSGFYKSLIATTSVVLIVVGLLYGAYRQSRAEEIIERKGNTDAIIELKSDTNVIKEKLNTLKEDQKEIKEKVNVIEQTQQSVLQELIKLNSNIEDLGKD